MAIQSIIKFETDDQVRKCSFFFKFKPVRYSGTGIRTRASMFRIEKLTKHINRGFGRNSVLNESLLNRSTGQLETNAIPRALFNITLRCALSH